MLHPDPPEISGGGKERTMAQARQAGRAFPQSGMYLTAAVIAALMVTTLITVGSMNFFGVGAPAVTHGQANPALIRAEQEWVRQRLEQTGYVHPAVRSAQEWERQRRQQSGTGD